MAETGQTERNVELRHYRNKEIQPEKGVNKVSHSGALARLHVVNQDKNDGTAQIAEVFGKLVEFMDEECLPLVRGRTRRRALCILIRKHIECRLDSLAEHD